jgi:hypothetical protein
MRAERIVKRAGGQNLLQRSAGVFKHGWRRNSLLIRVTYLAQRHDVDLLILIRWTGQVVPDDREIVPHGGRQAVKVDLMDLCNGLWGIRCRSGVPDLRGRRDDSQEDIYVVSVCQKRLQEIERTVRNMNEAQAPLDHSARQAHRIRKVDLVLGKKFDDGLVWVLFSCSED